MAARATQFAPNTRAGRRRVKAAGCYPVAGEYSPVGRFFTMLASLFAGVAAFAAPAPRCAEIPGVDRLWSDSHVRFVLAGEMHGTNETPALFGDLVCAAGASKRPIIVGIEHPAEEQEAMDAFMNSTDHETAVRMLLSRRTWNTFDGRSSRAMLALFQRLRALKASGRIAEVVAFDDSRPGEPDAQREARMAAALAAAAERRPKALVIALTGNVHASKEILQEIGPYPLMAMHLPRAETLSLFVADRGGEAWNSMNGGCGPHPVDASGGVRRGVVLSKGEGTLAGYDGRLSTGLPATASLPAIPDAPPPPACSGR